MLPTGPVLSPRDLPAFEAATPSPAVYDGDPRVPFLVLPVQIFGVLYQTDVVISTRHPRWDMHEYARIDTPEGHLWMAKDSDRAGVQTIIADLPDLDTVLAEVPVPRKRGAVVVQDDSEGEDIKLRLSYDNPDGEPVIAEYAGRMPAKPPRQRNGNTMGHSQHAVAVVLDISRMGSFRHRAAISIGGEQHRIKRVAGLVPMHFLLRQAQGGLAVTSFRQEAADDAGAFRLQRPAGAGERDPATGAPGWPTRRQEHWTVESVGDSQHLSFDSGLNQLHYHFVAGGLSRATVQQVAVDRPVSTLWVEPALPDLRRPFAGTLVSRVRMDVGEERGHGLGRMEARWIDADTVQVDFFGEKPRWLATRPLRHTLSFQPDGSVVVQAIRP